MLDILCSDGSNAFCASTAFGCCFDGRKESRFERGNRELTGLNGLFDGDGCRFLHDPGENFVLLPDDTEDFLDISALFTTASSPAAATSRGFFMSDMLCSSVTLSLLWNNPYRITSIHDNSEHFSQWIKHVLLVCLSLL